MESLRRIHGYSHCSDECCCWNIVIGSDRQASPPFVTIKKFFDVTYSYYGMPGYALVGFKTTRSDIFCFKAHGNIRWNSYQVRFLRVELIVVYFSFFVCDQFVLVIHVGIWQLRTVTLVIAILDFENSAAATACCNDGVLVYRPLRNRIPPSRPFDWRTVSLVVLYPSSHQRPIAIFKLGLCWSKWRKSA